MAADSKFKMSQERLDSLKEELHFLETVRAKEVSEQIKEARSFGDLSENSEYDEAKNEQGKLYSRIDELKALIDNAEVVEAPEMTHDAISIGSTVKLENLDDKSRVEFRIVGSQEANPMEKRISDESPLGRTLIGRKTGDTVSFEAPAGVRKYNILSVDNG